MASKQSGPPTDITRRMLEVTLDRARQLVVAQGVPGTAHSHPFLTSPQDERRAHALAVVQACAELTASLAQTADDAAREARRCRASYAEIGAARGITRQAARQALMNYERRLKLLQETRRAQISAEDEDSWWDERQRIREEQEQRWPPRAWTHRAPTGYRTVVLKDGPAGGRTFRVPVDDDAFPFIDRVDIFGARHDRYARYTPSAPRSDQYLFTGEYFVRWS